MLNQSLKLIRQQKPELLAVVGTTASGKSDLAIEIAKKIVRDPQFLGQYTGVDIINADSYSLYKKMDIGTAKPSIIERNKLYDEYNIKHLLFDILETKEIATAALFKNLADAEITKSQNARRLPVLCGGSGLYIRAVTDNFEFSDGAKSMLERTQNKRHRGEDGSLPEYTYANPRTLQIAIGLTREELDNRIEGRTEKMRDAALESEVRKLWENGLLGETAIKAIGYAEFVQYFAGAPNPANGKPLEVDDVYELIAMHTKRLVRRQQSWFKRDPRIFWL